MKTEFVVCDTVDEVTDRASELIKQLCANAIDEHGFASLAVSGGSTPQSLFRRWQAETFPRLESVLVFMSDERLVPLSSIDSNAGTMLRLWPDVAMAKVRLPDISTAPAGTSADYEQRVVNELGSEPVFDCVMLGLGEDGHTASLFPDKASLQDESLVCVAEHGSLPPAVNRLTLTFRCINNAANVVVIATGEKKRKWIDAYRNGDLDITTFPLSGVKPQGNLWFIVDRAAWPEA